MLIKPIYMQIISAAPLIKKIKNNTFEESEIGPYFLAYTILGVFSYSVTDGGLNFDNFLMGAASLIITVFGLLHLKKQNGESFGNQFLSKYIALGWVVSIRMLLIGIPVMVGLFAIAEIIGGYQAHDPAGVLFILSTEVIFYRWLGLLIKESNESRDSDSKVEQGTAS